MALREVIVTKWHYCGCQFKTEREAEARLHVEITGHKMWIQGSVLPKEDPSAIPPEEPVREFSKDRPERRRYGSVSKQRR